MYHFAVCIHVVGELNLRHHHVTKLSHKQIFPDNFMRREIMQLVVHCLYVETGCTWKGEVKDLEVRMPALENHLHRNSFNLETVDFA